MSSRVITTNVGVQGPGPLESTCNDQTNMCTWFMGSPAVTCPRDQTIRSYEVCVAWQQRTQPPRDASASVFWNKADSTWVPLDDKGGCAGRWKVDPTFETPFGTRGRLTVVDSTGKGELLCDSFGTNADQMGFVCSDTLSEASGEVFALQMTVACREDACRVTMNGRDAGTVYADAAKCRTSASAWTTTSSTTSASS